MARYIDAEQFRGKHEVAEINGKLYSVIPYADIVYAPTADVAPKSEVDRLEYTLLGVMHFVDKWLVGDELEQDEVNRAITMREKTLRIIETLKSEIAKEIIGIIEQRMALALEHSRGSHTDLWKGIYQGRGEAYTDIKEIIEQKYTEVDK